MFCIWYNDQGRPVTLNQRASKTVVTSTIESDTIGKISYEIDWVRDYLRRFESDCYWSTAEQLLVFYVTR